MNESNILFNWSAYFTFSTQNNQMSTPRQIRRGIANGNANNTEHGDTTDARSPKTSGTSTLMRGVNGDVKEAFGMYKFELVEIQANSND